MGSIVRPHVQSAASLNAVFSDLAREMDWPTRRADLIRSVALLWHDHLEAAHRIVQSVEDPDGNLVHAILHRREPDYANAKYWFRRVGEHPVFGPLATAARQLLSRQANPALERTLIPDGKWHPLAFVDECQECARLAGGHPRLATAVELQRLEFEVLLEHLCAW